MFDLVVTPRREKVSFDTVQIGFYDHHAPNDQNHGSVNNYIKKFFYSDCRKFVLSLKLLEKLWPALNSGSI